ncbi:polysaccharide biosynthesis protein [Cognatitamlana onchidii]|uniref:polysaccharide biosynthesis protein n=1 Tax=Cognatitamlana onchidii TaxID=2562860 RepID=UPI0010A62274|nr:polysaccharide biosynthesis protein [Algibacter onchidii]
MNKVKAQYIDELLDESQLFSTKNHLKANIELFDFSEETILVTGAAGSIGSELCNQLKYTPFKQLILVDIAESPLYSLIKNFEFNNCNNIKFLVLNITDRISVTHLFETYKPTMVFHTAAYKHVPLMEQNPYEAVKVNVFGTKSLADLSVKYHIKKFIFISTDKAVDPVSIMGMTKKIGENYLRSLSKSKQTLFLIARFGNIIGSNGSLIPLLKRQIELKLPITITDKNMTRFFIGKTRACHLIIKLSTLKSSGRNLFTFKMGDAVNIMDVLDRLLLKYNYEREDINIKYIGLRPGEKLHEQLTSKEESLIPTHLSDIFSVQIPETNTNTPMDINKLDKASPYMSNLEIKTLLKKHLKL